MTSHRVEETLDQGSAALHETQRAARRAMDRWSERAEDLRDEAAPMLDRLSGRAVDAARKSADWVREGTDRARHGVARVSQRSVGYVRDEPVRTVLMAVAAGALIYAVVRLMGSRADSER